MLSFFPGTLAAINVPAMLDSLGPWLPVMLFLCRVIDVSLGTVRTILVVRGARIIAPLLGFVEVSVWIVAVSSVVQRLHHPMNIVAYAGGFATGNWTGMWLEQKLAIGHQIVRIISRTRGHSVAHALRLAGFGVTTLYGRGKEGPIVMCFVVAARRQTSYILEIAREVDADCFTTIEDTRRSSHKLYNEMNTPKTGWRSVFHKK
jgi:uncharacterized protein YebE (UPF0316 family)